MASLFAGQIPPGVGRFSDGFLRAKRSRGDDAADAVILHLMEQNQLSGDILGKIRRLSDSGGVCRDFLLTANRIPSWADFPHYEAGKKAAKRHALVSGLSLLAGSLVESYAAALGAKVLIRTGRLKKDIQRRLFETAQFLFDIVSEPGPFPGSRSHDTILKVRLMHGVVRQVMLKREWNHEAWGYPVNQEDYAGTLLMFSYVFRRSMISLGVRLTEEEEKSLHALWRYVGFILGVDEDLLTENLSEEEYLYMAISARQCHPDADSLELAHSVLNALAGRKPFYLPEEALHAISRRLIGPDLAQSLRLKSSIFWDAMVSAMTFPGEVLSRFFEVLPAGAPAAEWSGEMLASFIIENGLSGEPVNFQQKGP